MDLVTLSELDWPAWLTLAVLAGGLATLVLSRVQAELVFMGALTVLLLAGVLEAPEALAGFGSTGLATVAALFVVVAGLQETGAISWISHHVLGRPRGRVRALARLMLPVTALSAFLNNTPVVAVFIPAVTEWARKIRMQPSQLLIPLSYASIFGGVCTLIGTSTNLVVNGMVLERYGGAGLGMFEVARLGLPCAVVGTAYLLVVGGRLLPARRALDEVFGDTREYTLELVVVEGSPMIGRTVEQSGLRHLSDAFLAEIIRGQHVVSAVTPEEVLEPGDRLVFVGNIDSMRTLYRQQGLVPAADQLFKLDAPRHERCLVEAVVSDTCPIIGKTIRDGGFRNRYNAVVIAVARNGERLGGKIGDIVLRAGDILLIESHAGFIPRQRDSRDFYLVSSVEDATPRRFDRAPLAIAILAAMVAAVALAGVPMLHAALAASGLVILTGCCSVAQARRGIEWNVLIVIGAALGLGRALDSTGVASAVAGALLALAQGNPLLTLAMVYLLTAAFTELITNTGAAVLMFPIAVTAAEGLGVDPRPFILCLMVAASASFATPIGYQTNLMVYGPGGYRYADYLRVGLPLSLLFALVAVTAGWLLGF